VARHEQILDEARPATAATRARTGDEATTPAADARLLTALGWLVGLILTGLLLGSPDVLFAYHSPELHLVLDSVDSCVALLLAYLLFARFRRTRRLQDLLLAEGLLLLAVAGLGLALVVDVLDRTDRQSFGVWLPLSLRVSAAVLILLAAAVRGRPARSRSSRLGLLVPAAVVLAVVVLLLLFRGSLPVAASASPPSSAQDPVITGHVLLLVAQSVSAACFLVASLSFTRQALGRPDEVLRWLGPACALAGFARVNYVLFPSLYSGWLYTGDLLRTACYLCLLVGATREIGRYWATHAQVAVLEDRRRLARELHDGVVQELGLIKAEARTVPVSERSILEACDRALDEARAAVDALGRDAEEPLGYALHRAAREVADRHGGHVAVELDDAVQAGPEQRHDLARITREAVGNALRHGAAECVRITLEAVPGGRRLVVKDDGSGFDPTAVSGGTGYGLTSMRDRARGLPGRLDVRSSPGEGTTVEVTW
jgi:signal transduction histidine kinase